MSFKKNTMDDDEDNDNNKNDDSQPFSKRQRFDNNDFKGRGRDKSHGSRGHSSHFEQSESLIKVGQVAPTFEDIMNDKSEPTSLQQFQGKYVVLFIFSSDDTSEQIAFRNAKNDFDKYDAVIIGASRDNVESHQKSIEEHQLNYTLLADTDGTIIKAYGAIDNDSVTSSTFLISPDGKVAAVWSNVVSFDKHSKEVARKLEDLVTGKTSDDESKRNRDENEENDENEEDEENEENENENENENLDENENEEQNQNEDSNEDDNDNEDEDHEDDEYVNENNDGNEDADEDNDGNEDAEE